MLLVGQTFYIIDETSDMSSHYASAELYLILCRSLGALGHLWGAPLAGLRNSWSLLSRLGPFATTASNWTKHRI